MTQSLVDLEVVVLDCQSTGANPRRGSLLEAAWARGRAASDAWEVRSHLVRLPRGRRIPARIATLTGITNADLAAALPPHAVWRRLRPELAATGQAVAHFARFERAFLEPLCKDPFPLAWICTHEIVCRLMPGLPRRGLRAVAGHLGHVMAEGKRAAAHVRANIAVWTEVVARLREAGVATLHDLRPWLESVAPVRRTGRDYAVERELRLGLPDAPGVYRMLGKGGQVLYLGKATSLKRRVNSYFQKRRHAGGRTPELLTQTFAVDVVVTGSPLEAALREVDEIKEHAPLYNVALRERDKRVWFASRDLRRVRARPGAAHRIGPLPRRDALAPVVAVRRLLAGRTDAETWAEALGLRPAIAPAALREGLALFRARHGTLHPWRGVGARLWRQWKEREPESDADDSEERDEQPARPADVAAALESAARHGAHLVRRARWLRRLCEASLVWRPPGSKRRRLLVLERGRVARVEDDADAPPDAGRGTLERLRCFDAATYDRLRVLTTELRRVVAEKRIVELRLAPRQRLDGDALARRLYWV
ncbi:MAG: GIY-YIG nuclease family protein [Planctomycetota bacterium]